MPYFEAFSTQGPEHSPFYRPARNGATFFRREMMPGVDADDNRIRALFRSFPQTPAERGAMFLAHKNTKRGPNSVVVREGDSFGSVFLGL